MKLDRRLFLVAFLFTWSSIVAVRGEETIRLRVLSYNIHHGEGMDSRLDLERIAKVILSVEPDLVALQEVDQNVPRSNQVDQTAELARLTKMHSVFGPNIVLQGGQYGNSVLSRHPIRESQNYHLPITGGGEQRGVLTVDVEVPGVERGLRLLATHFDHRRDSQQRLDSAVEIQRIMKDEVRPSILAGDLNDVADSETLHKLKEDWLPTNEQAMPTIPVDLPKRQIDFILVRPAAGWKVVETRVLDEAVASDHRAILSELELKQ